MTPEELVVIITPTVQDVADVIPRRATDEDGLGRGTFTTQTVPSAEQVERVCQDAARDIASELPTLRPDLYVQAVRVAALGAAMQVELSYYPEQQDSAGALVVARYRAAFASLSRATGRSGASPAPRGSFPPPYEQGLAEFAERPSYLLPWGW